MAGEPIMIDWDQLRSLTAGLAEQVAREGDPDVVVGVLRGGMVPAVLMCHALGSRELRAVDVTHTLSDKVAADKSDAPTVRNENALGELAGLDVLIVDDIAGSGDTLEAVHGLIAGRGAARIRSAVCIVNVANWNRQQPADQYVTYIGDAVERWVVFPWEAS
ncbi:phosphoribosyltransferase family protein [Catellatospora citrea]|uniref:phosphoribosyltransferase n=1 Tax=Catellatospora citrea TaxID=53366 RepID=UPI0033CBF172